MGDRPPINMDPQDQFAGEGTREAVKAKWTVLAVATGVVGLLAWMGWEATRADKADQDKT